MSDHEEHYRVLLEACPDGQVYAGACGILTTLLATRARGLPYPERSAEETLHEIATVLNIADELVGFFPEERIPTDG